MPAQTHETIDWLNPRWAAIGRVNQCVAFGRVVSQGAAINASILSTQGTSTSRAPRGDWTEIEGRCGWRLGWRVFSVPNQVRNVAHPRPDEVVGVADVPIPIQWVGNMITGNWHGLLPWAPVMWWAPIAIVCGYRGGI